MFGAVPKTRDEAKDFSWLPRMRDLAGHDVSMNDYLYDPDYNGEDRAALLKVDESEVLFGHPTSQ